MSTITFLSKLFSLLILTAFFITGSLVPVHQSEAATITIVNLDNADEGFNDSTPVDPVGGNTGMTVGEQRLIAFQHAADIWGAILVSNVEIYVDANFNSKTCDSSSAVLGSAGAKTVHRNFSGALFADTFYSQALANALHDSDLSGSSSDISASFNSSIDNNDNCLFNTNWYYGLDSNSGGDIDFLTVVLHELAHGLGFQTFIDKNTGAKFKDSDDAYMRHLEHHGEATPDFPSMTDTQRLAAITSVDQLHWAGPQVMAVSNYYTCLEVRTHLFYDIIVV